MIFHLLSHGELFGETTGELPKGTAKVAPYGEKTEKKAPRPEKK
jgi:hypothetical protein